MRYWWPPVGAQLVHYATGARLARYWRATDKLQVSG